MRGVCSPGTPMGSPSCRMSAARGSLGKGDAAMLLYLTAYWSVIAISLVNTILLLWLGFMVLFNAERRSWGIWLIGGGLLTGGAFFVSHTVILVLNPTSLEGAM